MSLTFKSMTVATAIATWTTIATATDSAANKTWIFKRKWQWWVGNTRSQLTVVNNYCHRAGGCFPSGSASPLPYQIDSLEAVAASWFQDPVQLRILDGELWFNICFSMFSFSCNYIWLRFFYTGIDKNYQCK